MRLKPACLVAFICTLSAASAQPNDMLSADNLVQVSPHVWVIKGFPNIAIAVGSKATLAIDTGLGTPNGKIVAEVAARLSTQGQKLYLTTTHYHAEHASGDGGFPPGTVVIRPKLQQAEMEAEGQKLMDVMIARSAADKALLQGVRIRPADILFDKDYKLDLGGGVTAQMSWFGIAHTASDELIMIDPDSVLVSGDVVQNKAGPQLYCAACTPSLWIQVLDQIAARFKPKIIVPDHSPVGDGSLIAQERAMLVFLQTHAKAQKALGKSADETVPIVTQEFQDQYPGWIRTGQLPDAIRRAYAE